MADMDPLPGGVRAIASSGYVFLVPLVTRYGAMYAEAIDPSSPAFGGGFGRWVHHRAATSHESEVAESHVTSLSSIAWLDVRSEPWLFAVPRVGPSCTTRVTDLWGFVIDESRCDDADVGPIVVAGDDWVGAIPPEATKVVRGESPFLRCETWGQMDEAGDLARIRGVQQAYRLEALSTWTSHPGPAAAPAIPWWPYSQDTLTSLDFWPAATFALSLTAPHDDDRGILARLAEIGVVPGTRWDAGAFRPAVIAAIEEGMDEALTELMRAASGSWDPTPPGSRTAADRDYFGRALAALRATPLVHPGRH